MEQLQKLIIAYVAKQHAMTEAQVADLLFEKSEDDDTKVDFTKLKAGVKDALLGKDVERIKAIKKDAKTTAFNDAQNKALREVTEKQEKRIAKKYNFDNEEGLKLDELLDAIVDGAKAEAGGTADKLTPDNVKKHAVYIKLEKKYNTDIEKLNTDHEAAIETLKKEGKKTETLTSVKSVGLKHFLKLNPVLSDDKVRAQNQQNDFLTKLNGYDYEPVGDDDYLLTKDGTRVEDDHGNGLTLTKFISNEATKLYDFAVQGKKGAAGNENDDDAPPVTVPKNEDEYNEAIFNAKTADERAAIKTAYEEANAQ